MKMRDVKGFSLVELMTVVAVVGLISAIAVPSYLSGMPKRRLTAATRELYGVMQQTRLLAVKDGQSKRLRFETNFYYRDDNNNKICDPGEKRIDLSEYHDVEFGGGAAKKNWNGDPLAQASYITFSPEGTANSSTVYFQNISAPRESFAITSQTSGALKIRWFNGSKWK
jgi:type II secretion system protein H